MLLHARRPTCFTCCQAHTKCLVAPASTLHTAKQQQQGSRTQQEGGEKHASQWAGHARHAYAQHHLMVGFFQVPDLQASAALRTLAAPTGSCCCGTRIRGWWLGTPPGRVRVEGLNLNPNPKFIRSNSLAEALNLLFTASTPAYLAGTSLTILQKHVLSRKPLERARGSNVCCYAPDDVAGRETWLHHTPQPTWGHSHQVLSACQSAQPSFISQHGWPDCCPSVP